MSKIIKSVLGSVMHTIKTQGVVEKAIINFE